MTHPVRRAVQFFLAIFIAVFSINLTGAMQAHATTAGDWNDNRETQLFARDINVTPTAPTKNDVCGLANDSYTITATTGVTYKVGVQTKNAGTHSTSGSLLIIIYAVANQGYDLQGTSSWTFVYTNSSCSIPVTANEPTKVDLCGTANDTYTVPSTTGVTYKLGASTVSQGTYPGNGTVVVTAIANQGYTLQGKSSWSFTFATTPCLIDVAPAAPTMVDLCNIANDSYTIPSQTGVTYRVNGFTKAAGTYSGFGIVYIKAYAANGYKLIGNDDWTFGFTALPCETTPAAPTTIDMCGTGNDTYTIPTTQGVTYFVNGHPKAAGTYSATGVVLIGAVAQPGYYIDIHTQALWLFTFSTKKCAAPCQVDMLPSLRTLTFERHHDNDDVDCIPVETTLTDPSMVDLCGTDDDTYTVGNEPGVTYLVNGVPVTGINKGSGTVVITAVAKPGYTIDPSAETSWTFDFTNTACPAPGMGSVGASTPSTPVVTVSAFTAPVAATTNELPTTGSTHSGVQFIAVLVVGILTYGATYYLYNRRKVEA